MNRYTLIAIVIVAFILLGASAYIVDQTEQVVITQFGEVIEPAVTEPGLHFKIPFIQKITMFDKRLLDYDAKPTTIYTNDKKNLIVDNYAKWKIVDPIAFVRKLRTESSAQARLDDIIYAGLREEIGLHTLSEVVSINREAIMDTVTQKCKKDIENFGVEIIDVRIKRADLPVENEKAVYERMHAERQRMAKQYRSEGKEDSLKISARADLERRSIEAEAYRRSEHIRGAGDSLAVKIYADAYRKAPEFYSFLRSLQAYKEAIDENTVLVLPLENEFLRYLGSSKEKR